MTKLRAPASFPDAVTRVAGLIGWAECARVTSRSDRAVRHWSDPDSMTSPTLDQAVQLDLAYRRAGGGDAPCFDTYALILEQTPNGPEDSDQLAARTASAARESGEAIAALAIASAPGASFADRAIAQREGQEAITAITAAIAGLGVPGPTS